MVAERGWQLIQRLLQINHLKIHPVKQFPLNTQSDANSPLKPNKWFGKEAVIEL